MRLRIESNRAAVLGIAAAGVSAVALRVPFIWAGIGPDEGGYAYVAREWARGVGLYRDIWIDRPQGLMLLYRTLTGIADEPWVIRAGAVVAGAAICVLLGAIAWKLAGPMAGIVAAVMYAVVGVGPHIEGFTLNGELAAAVPATAAIGAAVWWSRTGRWPWLVGAGAFGGAAILMKQSGFDGLAAVSAFALLAATGVAIRLKQLAFVAVGAAIPLGAAAIHGLTLGWGTYWSDVVGYRVTQNLSGTSGRSWPDAFSKSIDHWRPDLLALGIVATLGVVICVRRRRELSIAPIWLLAAVGGINVGGYFWPHYFVQVVPPLVLLGALGATTFRRRLPAIALTCFAVAPVVWSLGQLAGMSPDDRAKAVKYAVGYRNDRAVARFVKAHSTRGDRVLALVSRADFYFLADRRAAFPYLWRLSPLEQPRNIAALRDLLASPHRPRIVVRFQDPNGLDPSGRLAAALRANYRQIWVYRGTPAIPVFGAREMPARVRGA